MALSQMLLVAVVVASASGSPVGGYGGSVVLGGAESYASISTAPVVASYAAPAVVAAPTVSYKAVPAVTAYAAPAISYKAVPAVTAYAAPTVTAYATPAVSYKAVPAVATYAAPAVSYKAVPAVATYAAPAVSYKAEPEIIAYPRYAFKYGVTDGKTGDVKDQAEERDGDVVKGEYSLIQPDGRKRVVSYLCDGKNGCNQVVSYSGEAVHPQVVQVPVKLAAYGSAY